MDHSLTDPLTDITDDSLSEELLPENNLHEGQNLALDTDYIDYSALGNIDPDLNILFYNNTMNCNISLKWNSIITSQQVTIFHCSILTFEAYLKMLSIYNIFLKV